MIRTDGARLDRRMVLVAAVLVAVLARPALARTQPDITPRLSRALATDQSPWRDARGRYAVWVTFTDKQVTGVNRDRLLASLEAALPERTRRRRAKMLPAGAPLVTERDLPLAAPYVDAVLATGAQRRQESRWLDALSVDATADEIARIAALDCVARLDLVARFQRRPVPDTPDGRRSDAATKSAPTWSIDYGLSLDALAQIDVPPVHELGFDGQGVVIGMLDTGFRTSHDALTHIPVLAAHDFINDDDVVVDEPGDPPGQHDHGTKTLSTIMGYAPGHEVGPAFGASVILAKTEDTSQEVPIEEDYWVAGIEWEEGLGADVVSSSLGYYDWYDFSDLDGNTAVTTIAADIAVSLGVCVVNSAGNERGAGHFGHIIAPADGDSVIAVGAVDSDGNVASFSSPGPTYDGRIKPDVAALGVSVPCAVSTDDTSYTHASGTSLSCPLAAGVAALVLARAPMLTPIQVREAMRESASHAATPDNDTGWGILDAYAAVTYWGPVIAHTPLTDTEDLIGPYVVSATITDRLTLQPAQMTLHWRADAGTWLDVPLAPQGGDLYAASIPGQSDGTLVDYYLEVVDAAAIATREPAAAPEHVHSFHVGTDVTPPEIFHQPLGDQPLATWPPQVVALVQDNLGVDHVQMSWSIDGGPLDGPQLLADQGGGAWTTAFPISVDELRAGDEVSYTITAFDSADVPNTTTSGPYTFTIVDVPGVIGVIDESDHGLIAPWAEAAGYQVGLIDAASITSEDLAPYQVIVYSAGAMDGSLPSNTALRGALLTWSAHGGKLLIEGGNIASACLDVAGLQSFVATLLHTTSVHAGLSSQLLAAPGQAGHNLLTYPHLLDLPIDVATSSSPQQDFCAPAADATLVLTPPSFPTYAGLLYHDDDAEPQAAQLVYLPCDLEIFTPEVGRDLVENALAFLLAVQAPPAATVAGHVVLAGSSDATGVIVTCGDDSTQTQADGAYLLGPFAEGTYTVTARKPGYLPAHQIVMLAHAQQLTGVDLALQPVAAISVSTAPELPIPDAGAGIVSPVTVTAHGACAGISVDIDITHPAIGDLTVQLIDPQGTQVVLHDHTGGDGDDLIGNWPLTLAVDGPGSLDDLLGHEIHGTWYLYVADTQAPNAGTLHGWGLNLLVPVTAVPGDVPAATRLVAVAPNPFNPRTTVSFDVAVAGRVTLAIYDVLGRRVRALVDGAVAAGRHEVVWDGRDAAGRAFASGTYVCRLVAGGTITQQKMMLVR